MLHDYLHVSDAQAIAYASNIITYLGADSGDNDDMASAASSTFCNRDQANDPRRQLFCAAAHALVHSEGHTIYLGRSPVYAKAVPRSFGACALGTKQREQSPRKCRNVLES